MHEIQHSDIQSWIARVRDDIYSTGDRRKVEALEKLWDALTNMDKVMKDSKVM